jgi:hypothetical protein
MLCRSRVFLVSVLLISTMTGRAAAQQRPLLTEDPETIGAGRVLIEGGVDYFRGHFFPISGLTGDLTRLPILGVSVGLSSIADLQVDGGPYNRLRITDRAEAPMSDLVTAPGDTTTGVEDLMIGMKIRMVSESESTPGIGLRFATRLPNSSLESGIGRDTTDFFASLLLGKTVQSVRIVGNAGVALLSDPTRSGSQNDVFIFGFSVARA